MELVTLELLGRHLVKLQTAILMRIDGTLQGIRAKNRALLRRNARQNRDVDVLRDRLAALGAKT